MVHFRTGVNSLVVMVQKLVCCLSEPAKLDSSWSSANLAFQINPKKQTHPVLECFLNKLSYEETKQIIIFLLCQICCRKKWWEQRIFCCKKSFQERNAAIVSKMQFFAALTKKVLHTEQIFISFYFCIYMTGYWICNKAQSIWWSEEETNAAFCFKAFTEYCCKQKYKKKEWSLKIQVGG
jgi:hypothetical protein